MCWLASSRDPSPTPFYCRQATRLPRYFLHYPPSPSLISRTRSIAGVRVPVVPCQATPFAFPLPCFYHFFPHPFPRFDLIHSTKILCISSLPSSLSAPASPPSLPPPVSPPRASPRENTARISPPSPNPIHPLRSHPPPRTRAGGPWAQVTWLVELGIFPPRPPPAPAPPANELRPQDGRWARGRNDAIPYAQRNRTGDDRGSVSALNVKMDGSALKFKLKKYQAP